MTLTRDRKKVSRRCRPVVTTGTTIGLPSLGDSARVGKVNVTLTPKRPAVPAGLLARLLGRRPRLGGGDLRLISDAALCVSPAAFGTSVGAGELRVPAPLFVYLNSRYIETATRFLSQAWDRPHEMSVITGLSPAEVLAATRRLNFLLARLLGPEAVRRRAKPEFADGDEPEAPPHCE